MKDQILTPLAKRGRGEIYLGVVGAVRTGKSTFIKKVIENLVVPCISDEIEKKRCLDEIPQTAQGKTIMTTEPKFVPSSGAEIQVEDLSVKVKLVDCVGYVVPNANGYQDEEGNPRMVMTPWFNEAIPFTEAASIGTEKVIRDHATIGIVVTTDGSIGELKREDYIEAEEKVVHELQVIGKPFVVLLNTKTPTASSSVTLAQSLTEQYQVPVLPISILDMRLEDIESVLKEALNEFPVNEVAYSIPEWVSILPDAHEVKKEYLSYIKESSVEVSKMRDVSSILEHFKESKVISKYSITNLDAGTGVVTVSLDSEDSLYNEVLETFIGGQRNTKANLLRVFSSYAEGKGEFDSIKSALKQAKSCGYGIVYPQLSDMHLDTPEIIKQGNRYGVKLRAVASSIHMMKVDVVSTFEPIIGSELQSKELIDYIMKDYENDPQSIWKSEIFGRSLDTIVQEGIQAKLSIMPENTRYKLSQTVTKIVNKGSNNLIAIVL